MISERPILHLPRKGLLAVPTAAPGMPIGKAEHPGVVPASNESGPQLVVLLSRKLVPLLSHVGN